MKNGERLSLEQIRASLEASEEYRFEGSKRKEVYDWVTGTLVEHEYSGQQREAKGVLRQYIGKMTGLSRAQVTRLIGRYHESGMVKERGYRRNRFACRYTPADIEQLAAVDEAHETLSGPATQKILYREFYEYGDERYRRLCTISVPHIYNLRKGRVYRDSENLLPEDAAGAGEYWRAAATRPARQARVPADRHGASGRPGRHEGGVPHQCRGGGDAVA